MLEQFAQRCRGVVLVLMVFLLCAVFALQFGGPQAEGCATGGQGGSIAKVDGYSISRNELQAAFMLAGGEGYTSERAKEEKLHQTVLNGLIERTLLAREARKIGFHASEDDVLEKAAEDGILHVSTAVDAPRSLPSSGPQRFDFKDKDGKFNKDNLRNFIQYRLRRSMKEFTRSQVEETLAQKMREAVVANVSVAPGEVWDAYVREKESVQLDYVRFSKSYYEQKAKPSVAELDAWIAANSAVVDAEYEKQKARYTGLEKQVRARHILIKVPSGATPEEKAEKRAAIDALLARAKKGEDFAKLATQNSEDAGSAKDGGDLGFNPKGRMVAPFDEAQFALAVGGISDVVESTFGFHIIKVEAIREGDVPLVEAKREISEKLYTDAKAKELAKAAADKLLAAAKPANLALADALTAVAANSIEGALNGPAIGEEKKEDPGAPEVRQTRPFGRADAPISGPSDSTPLAVAAYALTEQAPLGAEPMLIGDDYYVYRLTSRTNADKEGFTADEQARIQNGLTRRKQIEALDAYIRELVERATADKQILVDTAALDEVAGAPQPNS